jgi:hypothetical protein
MDGDVATPVAELVFGPRKKMHVTRARFEFVSNEDNSSFQCSVDGAAFHSCRSPVRYKRLKRGSHTFTVEAVDPAGNRSEPVTRTWKVVKKKKKRR